MPAATLKVCITFRVLKIPVLETKFLCFSSNFLETMIEVIFVMEQMFAVVNR